MASLADAQLTWRTVANERTRVPVWLCKWSATSRVGPWSNQSSAPFWPGSLGPSSLPPTSSRSRN